MPAGVDTFTFRKYQNMCNTSHQFSQLILTSNTPTTFTSSDIGDFFVQVIPIQTASPHLVKENMQISNFVLYKIIC